MDTATFKDKWRVIPFNTQSIQQIAGGLVIPLMRTPVAPSIKNPVYTGNITCFVYYKSPAVCGCHSPGIK